MSDIEKTITAYARIDWKSEQVNVRKTKPKQSDLGTNELLAELEFNVHIPDVDVPTLAAEIHVPEPMVYEAVAASLHDEDVPSFASAASEAIGDEIDTIQGSEDLDMDSILDRVTVETMRNAPGRPDVEDVERYVAGAIYDIADDDMGSGQ